MAANFFFPIILFLSLSSCVYERGEEPQLVSLTESEDFLKPSYLSYESSRIIPDLQISDDVNDTVWRYHVIVPLSFDDQPEKQYPVLYLLHGLDSGHTSWVNFGIKDIINFCLSDGMLPEMIIVMPQGGETYWVDGYKDNIKYETFFIEKFMPAVEENFRVDKKLKRNIAGFSMGGYGALKYAFSHPDLFGYCYAMSSPVNGKNTPETRPIIDIIKEILKGDLPYFSIDIGISDKFFCDNKNFHDELDLLGIPHEYIVRDGGHDYEYWASGLNACLLRIGRLQ